MISEGYLEFFYFIEEFLKPYASELFTLFLSGDFNKLLLIIFPYDEFEDSFWDCGCSPCRFEEEEDWKGISVGLEDPYNWCDDVLLMDFFWYYFLIETYSCWDSFGDSSLYSDFSLSDCFEDF